MFRSFLAAPLLVATLTPAHGAVLFYDDFSPETIEFNTTLDNWDIVQGSVDVVFCAGASNRCVDLDGSTFGTAPTIMQTKSSFGITAGNTYDLAFSIPAINLNGNDPFTVSFGSFSQSFDGNPVTAVLSFVATSNASSKIEFALQSAFNNNFGPFLSSVSLRETVGTPPPTDVSAVPLPASALFLLAGLGMLGVVRRRG